MKLHTLLFIALITWPLSLVTASIPIKVPHSFLNSAVMLDNGFKYQLITPAFSDYAYKIRSIHTPIGTHPTLKNNQIDFPVGTTIVKSFYFNSLTEQPCVKTDGRVHAMLIDQREREGNLPGNNVLCPIETRTLTKTADGWVPHVYFWENHSPKAIRYGQNVPITLHSQSNAHILSFEYHVPNLNECSQCHQGSSANASGIAPIGPAEMYRINFAESDFPKAFMDRAKYQISAAQNSIHALNNKEKLAREYLDINCAHCHNPNGVAASSAVYFSLKENQPTKLGICKRPVAIGGHTSGRIFDIHPGQPERSIIMERIQSLDSKIKMPELSKATLDPVAADVISNWISLLPGECEAHAHQ